MKQIRKLISLILAMALLCSLLPITAMDTRAAEVSEDTVLETLPIMTIDVPVETTEEEVPPETELQETIPAETMAEETVPDETEETVPLETEPVTEETIPEETEPIIETVPEEMEVLVSAETVDTLDASASDDLWITINGEEVYGYFYAQLTKDEKRIYDTLAANIYGDSEVAISLEAKYTIDEFSDMLQKATFALEHDYPIYEMYWSMSYTGEQNFVACRVAVNVPVTLMQTAIERLEQYFSTVQNEKNRYLQLRKLFTILYYETVYEIDYCDPLFTTEGIYHSALGLGSGRLVCDGYASVVKILCNRLQIPCIIVEILPYLGDVGHAYNYIKMDDDQWYIADATNSGYDANEINRYLWSYFLIGSENIDISGNISYEQEKKYADVLTYPMCSKVDYSYIGTIGKDTYTLVKNDFLDCPGTFTYKVNADGTTCTITGYHGSAGGDLIVPDYLDGYKVTVIGEAAFYGQMKFTGDIIIPDSVTIIEDNAFRACTEISGELRLSNNLNSIGKYAFMGNKKMSGQLSLPEGLQKIDKRAFYNCKGLTGNVVLPDSLQEAISPFLYCSGLNGVLHLPDGVIINSEITFGTNFSSFSVNNTNPNYSIYDGVLYSKDLSELISCPPGKTGSLRIADNVRIIREGSCYRCAGLTGELILPEGLEIIEDWAFNETGFTGDLIIPDSVTSIGECAFQLVKFNGELKLPKELVVISDHAFMGCDFTGNLSLPSNVQRIGDYALYQNLFTGSLVIPESVTYIGEMAFSMCYFTGDFTVPETVAFVGREAFDGIPFSNFSCHCNAEIYTEVVENVSCTVDGIISRWCSNCLGMTTYVETATGHKEKVLPGKAATCTENGLSQGKQCSVCNEILVAQEEIPATGHKWDRGTVTREPTESRPGIRTYTCTVCGETSTEEIPMVGHTHSYSSVVTAPTCTEKGYTTYTCACGNSYTGNETAALGHKWDKGVVTKVPGAFSSGTCTYTCTVCGETRTEEIPSEQTIILHAEGPYASSDFGLEDFYSPDVFQIDDTHVMHFGYLNRSLFMRTHDIAAKKYTDTKVSVNLPSGDWYIDKVLQLDGEYYAVLLRNSAFERQINHIAVYDTAGRLVDEFTSDSSVMYVGGNNQPFVVESSEAKELRVKNGQLMFETVEYFSAFSYDAMEASRFKLTDRIYAHVQRNFVDPANVTITFFVGNSGDTTILEYDHAQDVDMIYKNDKLYVLTIEGGLVLRVYDSSFNLLEERVLIEGLDTADNNKLRLGIAGDSIWASFIGTAERTNSYLMVFTPNMLPQCYRYGDHNNSRKSNFFYVGNGTFLMAEQKSYYLLKAEVTGHTCSYTTAIVEPTCTEKGYTIYTCACGDSYTGNEVAALGHKWDSGVVTKQPTTSAPGVRTYTCTVCKTTRNETIPYEAPASDSVYRISGKDRVKTALSVARALKDTLKVDKFDAVIIATGVNEKFADALAGSYLANMKKAPILLYTNSGLSQLNVNFIQENLKANGTVYILGGTGAIPETVEETLSAYTVKRLSGKTRYETNLEILKEAGVSGASEILVATGTNFADSLSASAVGLPLLLVNGKNVSPNAVQTEFLKSVAGKKITIIGGDGAVSEEMKVAIEAITGVTAERISGKTRHNTSVMIAQKYFSGADFALITYAKNFPDGLAGGPLAYAMGAPLLLTNAGQEGIANSYITAESIERGYVLGGDSAVSDETARKVFGLAADAAIEKAYYTE